MPYPAAPITVGDEHLTVWVADEAAERQQGLRQVEGLPAGIDGMLFVYESPTNVTFGMLDTLMPLDIWWFDSSASLVGGAVMDPCPAKPCVGYRSPGPISWVLETPAGSLGLEPGAVISTVESG